MDSLTQGLIAAVSSKSISGKKCSVQLMLMAVISSTVGDLDILVRSNNPVALFIYHRQFTHSLLAIVLGGLTVAAIFLIFSKQLRAHWVLTCITSIIAYGLHIFLDVCTSFGTQIFWPWSTVRVSLNILPIVDPIIAVILLLGLFCCGKERSRMLPTLSIFMVGLYIIFAAYQHHRVTTIVDKSLPRSAKHLEVLPTLGQVYIWHVLYQYKNHIVFQVVNTPYLASAYTHQKVTLPLFKSEKLSNWVKSNKHAMNDYKIFNWFSNGYLTVINQQPLIIASAKFIISVNPLMYLWSLKFSRFKNGVHISLLRRRS